MEPVKKTAPVQICLVLKRTHVLGNVRPGERVTLRPPQAMQMEAGGLVKILTEPLKPADVQAAGGVKKLLETQNKLRKITVAQEKMLDKQFEKFAPPKPAEAPDQQV